MHSGEKRLDPEPQAGNPFAASQVAPEEEPVEYEPYRWARVSVLLVGVIIVAAVVGFFAAVFVGAFVERDDFDGQGFIVRIAVGGVIGLAAGGVLYAICKEEL